MRAKGNTTKSDRNLRSFERIEVKVFGARTVQIFVPNRVGKRPPHQLPDRYVMRSHRVLANPEFKSSDKLAVGYRLKRVLKSLMLDFLFGGEAMEHQVDHGQADEGFADFGRTLEILRETTIAHEPPERALHDPSFRQHLEGTRPRLAAHDLQSATGKVSGRHHEFLRVPSVRPQVLQTGKMPRQSLQNRHRPRPIQHVCCVDHHRQVPPLRVHFHVVLAASDLLARVVPAADDPPFSDVLTVWLSRMAAPVWSRRRS